MISLMLIGATFFFRVPGEEVMGIDSRIVEQPFAARSTWELVWVERDGKRKEQSGKLDLRPNGQSIIELSPCSPWLIFASRIRGGHDSGSVELDFVWDNEFGPGLATIGGIYMVRGDCLWFCYVFDLTTLPADYTTKVDDGRTLLVFKRTSNK